MFEQDDKNLRSSSGDVEVDSWTHGSGVQRSVLMYKFGSLMFDADTAVLNNPNLLLAIKTNINSNNKSPTHNILHRER